MTPPPNAPFGPARRVVVEYIETTLEDVSRADASAETIARTGVAIPVL